MLYNELKENACTIEFPTSARAFYFPDVFGSYNEFKSKKVNKKVEFESLVTVSDLSPEHLKKSYESLKSNVWKPVLQQKIEKNFMEKVSWEVSLKKIAGSKIDNIPYIHPKNVFISYIKANTFLIC